MTTSMNIKIPDCGVLRGCWWARTIAKRRVEHREGRWTARCESLLPCAPPPRLCPRAPRCAAPTVPLDRTAAHDAALPLRWLRRACETDAGLTQRSPDAAAHP